jgi:hypothetical protein
MLVMTFDPSLYNYVVVGERSYFLLRLPDGSNLMVNDRCSHRGGPLHLGHWDDDEQCLVCPWHQTKYRESALKKRAVPLICRGGQATAILDADSDVEVRLCKKTILAQPCLNGDSLPGRH